MNHEGVGWAGFGSEKAQRSLTNLVQSQENTNAVFVQDRDWPMQQIAVYPCENSLASQPEVPGSRGSLIKWPETNYVYSDFFSLMHSSGFNKSKAYVCVCVRVNTETNSAQATAFGRPMALMDFRASGRIRSFEIWYQIYKHMQTCRLSTEQAGIRTIQAIYQSPGWAPVKPHVGHQ